MHSMSTTPESSFGVKSGPAGLTFFAWVEALKGLLGTLLEVSAKTGSRPLFGALLGSLLVPMGPSLDALGSLLVPGWEP